MLNRSGKSRQIALIPSLVRKHLLSMMLPLRMMLAAGFLSDLGSTLPVQI